MDKMRMNPDTTAFTESGYRLVTALTKYNKNKVSVFILDSLSLKLQRP